MRALGLCEAHDLPALPKNTEGIPSKRKRLLSRGILAEAEPGLFTQPRPWQRVTDLHPARLTQPQS